MVLASSMSLESGEGESYAESPLVCMKLAYYLKLFNLKMWHQEISFSKSLHIRPVLYPVKSEEIYGIVSYQNFPCHFALLLRENFNTSVTSRSYVGHIQIPQWFKWVNKCDPLSTLFYIPWGYKKGGLILYMGNFWWGKILANRLIQTN